MAKPLKYYQTLNLAPRSAKNHGKHRRAGTPAHGHSIVGTDYSAGGSDQDGTITITWAGSNSWSAIDFAAPEPKPPTIPHAGIRTGELIGHRLWWLVDGQLCSLAHKRLWAPDETIHGDTNKAVDGGGMFFNTIWGGTYAFFDADDRHIAKEMAGILANVAEYEACMRRIGVPPWSVWGWNPYEETGTFVRGTIKMWGEVIEHEHGYRAEFAKLNSLDAMYGRGDLDALRAKYLLSR